MAAENPTFGEGTTLHVNDGGGGNFVLIDDTTSVDPPDLMVMEFDRNRLSVTTLVDRTFGPRKDPGELTFVYENKLNHFQRMNALHGVDKSWRVQLTDGLRLAFTGTMKSNKPENITGGQINSARVVVRMTSLITVSNNGA
jgi:hypothetical protein